LSESNLELKRKGYILRSSSRNLALVEVDEDVFVLHSQGGVEVGLAASG
jgi:hypothetical protein